jgi:hypothetical protein
MSKLRDAFEAIKQSVTWRTFAKMEAAITEAEETIARLTRERDGARAALENAKRFIENGIEFGFITMPDDPIDPAHKTLPMIRAALKGDKP